MRFILKLLFLLILNSYSFGNLVYARVSVAPFVSMSSTKKIKPAADKKETETLKQRTTYGVRGELGFYRLLKFQLSVGQNELVTTDKTSEAKDEFGEINFEKDLNMSTADPESEVKVTEKMLQAKVGLAIDPSFSIFIMRVKAGVQANQRSFKLEQTGQEVQSYTSPITYKPYAGAGAGIRFSPRMYFMSEYGFYFYKFPETEPFEREVSVSFNVSI
ncbi:MAG: hypothetical protein KBD78_07210 [Oligoflexales bacterium]|nr:hypothetical protein [Oligoflexales bacterium]